jgi:hypothetical protein
MLAPIFLRHNITEAQPRVEVDLYIKAREHRIIMHVQPRNARYRHSMR